MSTRQSPVSIALTSLVTSSLLAALAPGCGSTTVVCPDGFQMTPEGRCVLPDAGPLPADGSTVDDAGSDAGLDAGTDAHVEGMDAGPDQPDAFVAPPDAFVEVPDAFVEPADAYVPPPDAYVPPPDACAYGTWYADADGDGYGDLASPRSGCSQPAGTVTDATDCDDTRASRHPGAAEVCDGVDQNCNGVVDEGAFPIFYYDGDGDGFGDASTTLTTACVPPAHYVAMAGDCNDREVRTYPGNTEVCDGIDNNCVGGVDEGVLSVFYRDVDGDTYGNPLVSVMACAPAAGYVTDARDCNDSSATIHPSAPELCNGVDDDCDGTTDEGVTTTYYADCDRDGYAAAGAEAVTACTRPIVAPASCTMAIFSPQWITRAPTAGATDCMPYEARAFPGSTQTSTTPIPGTTSYDWNCDGASTTVVTALTPMTPYCHWDLVRASCQPSAQTWYGAVPACGGRSTLYTCSGTSVSSCHETLMLNVAPECH